MPDPGFPIPDPGSRSAAVIAAAVVATAAFWAYTKTLLPGVDFGDTGGFQAAVLWPEVSARQAYPLYYDLAAPFVRAVSLANPARGLNLFSAISGAAAVGLVTYLGALIAESLAAGVVAGLLLAFSYTFWSQAVIAEVYALHLTLIVVSCLALHAYAQRPSRLRLAIFFGAYALAFGNHLSMILLLVPFAVFLLQVTPDRRTLFAPTTIAVALIMATAGALQYWPNFISTSHLGGAPMSWSDRLATFWFDTTKVDWRESMVMGVRGDQLADRVGMWWFDARQQFGVLGLLLAVVGTVRLWAISRPWATLFVLAYTINTVFAFTYNVGDTHVFYLPGHLFTVFLAGAALAPFGGFNRLRASRSGESVVAVAKAESTRPPLWRAATILLIMYAGWRAWDTWPTVDRHDDRRAESLVTRLALGANPRSAVLVTDLNWQVENALLYYTRWQRRDVPWVRMPDVQLHFPLLVRDNEAISRDMILDASSARDVVASFGPMFPIQPDPISASPDLIEEIGALSPGTPYVLCVLTPPREERLDSELLRSAVAMLTRDRIPTGLQIGAVGENGTGRRYQLMAGVAGEAPIVARAEDSPFRMDFRLLDDRFTVRMESWLPSDTFRRAGFGHVLRGREHVLTLERGVSLVWFDRNARASNPIYAASVYSPGHRYRLSSVSPSLAALGSRPISGADRP